jgi:glyoxylase-like metal-dependent hydrolase (beta-lactamase superfamily II)
VIRAVLDDEGSFATHREAFGVDDDRPWTLPFNAFLARVGELTVLVDTGLGPPGEDPFLPERRGLLPGSLDPAEVDLVVLTHLHVDHVGWNMREGEPFFPRARYVAHRADYDFFTGARAGRPYVRDQVIALEATGRLELVDADAELAPGVELRRAPGHTPGHCVVRLGEAVILGDLAVHELQLADPGLAYVAEEDPAQAAATRRRLLEEHADGGQVVGLSHLGLGRLRRDGSGFRWEPLG